MSGVKVSVGGLRRPPGQSAARGSSFRPGGRRSRSSPAPRSPHPWGTWSKVEKSASSVGARSTTAQGPCPRWRCSRWRPRARRRGSATMPPGTILRFMRPLDQRERGCQPARVQLRPPSLGRLVQPPSRVQLRVGPERPCAPERRTRRRTGSRIMDGHSCQSDTPRRFAYSCRPSLPWDRDDAAYPISRSQYRYPT